MRVVELFSGTASFSKVAKLLGHETLTVDFDSSFGPDLLKDILFLKVQDLPVAFQHPDIIWASPPCQAFSVVTISKNWRGKWPISDKARLGISLFEKTLFLIKQLNPKYFFIENPRGMARKLDCLQGFRRVTVTYCRYGFSYMKPTDIWTCTGSWFPRKACHAGDRCHDSQPRGYQSKKLFSSKGKGCQGLSGAKERGAVPPELCREILEACRL